MQAGERNLGPVIPRWRILDRPVRTADLVEVGMWAVLAYFVLGFVWLFTHYDTVTEFQTQWADVLPRFGELVGFVIAFLLWPVLLLLPSACVLPWA